MRLRWEIATADRSLTADEVERLTAAHRPLVRPRDGWVLLDDRLARRLRRTPRELTGVQALTAARTVQATDLSETDQRAGLSREQTALYQA
ncbi:hypothetical protein H1D24_41300 [Streptomyces sp. PSKA28]|uniref:DUF3670 domain-containing protein n=1 Tax=Streptomyces himalayensis subsp. himalayensis TaxID=2756131 RepID=A0A7W0DVJ1_9ACTN|nr:hypothetical protein [Streptomyces himalayensis subsp. himalayensis]